MNLDYNQIWSAPPPNAQAVRVSPGMQQRVGVNSSGSGI